MPGALHGFWDWIQAPMRALQTSEKLEGGSCALAYAHVHAQQRAAFHTP